MPVSPEERQDGWRQAPAPNDHQVAILRRVSRGHIAVTEETDEDGKKERSFAYDDGTEVHNVKGGPLHEAEFNRMVAAGWLIRIEGEDGRYRARNANDPVLPRILKKQKSSRAAKRPRRDPDATASP